MSREGRRRRPPPTTDSIHLCPAGDTPSSLIYCVARRRQRKGAIRGRRTRLRSEMPGVLKERREKSGVQRTAMPEVRARASRCASEWR